MWQETAALQDFSPAWPCCASSPCRIWNAARCPFSAGEEREHRAPELNQNFYPRSLRPRFFPSCEKWDWQHRLPLIDGRQPRAVLRIKALWRLQWSIGKPVMMSQFIALRAEHICLTPS
jgi:hypothetical protein